ncbi:transposase family protein [Xanthomonas theicola]|nr:transposase family protein [Xanthomonas theicola]
MNAIRDRTIRHIRDLPVFEDPAALHVPRLRLVCRFCGPRLERPDWLEPIAG